MPDTSDSVSSIAAYLEPELAHLQFTPTPQEAALLSIGISLKRIADAVEGSGSRTGIHELIWKLTQQRELL